MTPTPFGDAACDRPELEAPALSGLAAPVREITRSLVARLWGDALAARSSANSIVSQLEAFASAGLYGIFALPSEGGLGLGLPELCAVVEELASGSVAPTFVWAQHLRLLGAMLSTATSAEWRDRLKSSVISGRVKGGVALTGLLPGPPRLSASSNRDGWILRGDAPWVSGWGIVDILVIAARGVDGTIVWLLLDAVPQPGLGIKRANLSALGSTETVSLTFDGVCVGNDRAIASESYEAARERSEEGLRVNGSFALGVAKRCCMLIGPSALDRDLVACREALDEAGRAGMPAARAAANELAVRAAHGLAVTRGSISALTGDVAERLTREASLLLVFGSRPAIKEALLRQLGANA